MTDRLYLPDADDVTAFSATVKTATEDSIVLDGTYFYPEGGGQPADHGRLEWGDGSADVIDVQQDGGAVKHYIADIDGTLPDDGDAVDGQIDEERRQRHRRMHTAQHVLSRVVLDEYGAEVAGNQIHADRSRIDFEPADFTADDIDHIEAETNDIIRQGLPVEKTEMDRETLDNRIADGRSKLELIPDHVDPLRVVKIGGFDLCPCGGTHVDNLDEIGRITIIDRTSKGANVERITFELAGR